MTLANLASQLHDAAKAGDTKRFADLAEHFFACVDKNPQLIDKLGSDNPQEDWLEAQTQILDFNAWGDFLFTDRREALALIGSLAFRKDFQEVECGEGWEGE